MRSSSIGLVGSVGFMTLLAGCGLPAAETAEPVGSTMAAITGTQDGFSINWTQVGAPSSARKLTATLGSNLALYALNADKSFWINGDDGADGYWQFLQTAGSAAELGYSAGTPAGAITSGVFALNTNKTLWRYDYNDVTQTWFWTHVGTPSQAAHIQTGGSVLMALNTNQTLWTSPTGADNAWTFRGTLGQAARVTGAPPSFGNSAAYRAFALNTNGSLWYNDTILSSSQQAWRPLFNGNVQIAEIAASSSQTLFALTTGSQLWKGTTVETSCFDGVDNDASGAADSSDPACYAAYAQQFCQNHANGNYCYSRFTNDTVDLATCAGGQLASTYHGSLCTQVGSGGNDTDQPPIQ